ncbi:hypothetical protein B9K06_19025 [Bacillus sp. OG2]|nr:hypothetical protein B9K06_19025 [Bacillus sp. OG2]
MYFRNKMEQERGRLVERGPLFFLCWGMGIFVRRKNYRCFWGESCLKWGEKTAIRGEKIRFWDE